MDGTVLIADDDRTIRTVLTQAFSRAGCKVHATSSLTTLMRWVDEGLGDLVISDVVMPDGNGLETLEKIGNSRPGLPVIIISAQNTIMTAIKAAESEAYDYLPKPFDLPDLMNRSAKAMARTAEHAQPDARKHKMEDLPLVGRTPVMQELYRVVARVLNTDLPVMITGESGTGKSVIARSIHDFSDRRSRPYIIAGAADLEMPDQIQAMLISAKAGSILFDEVGDLSLDAQSQLVRALDGLGDNAPRLMASTQQDLGHAVENRSFRSDLYYRLNAVALSAPPLRLRIDDIPILAEYFLAHLDSKGNEGQKFSAEAVAQLRKHTWPGNVRQLEHMVQRLAATCPETTISSTDILSVLGPISPAAQSTGDIGHARLADSINVHITRYFELHGDVLPPAGLYARILKEMETPLLEIALEYTRGNQAKCADLLGINRNTLRKKVTELDINVTRRRKMM